MDGWKDRMKSGRKESGFENLKTRFQDCNLSRKQESKFSGWHENRLSAKRESKFPTKQENYQSAKKASSLCGKIESKTANKNESKQENNTEILPACLLATWNERKLSVHLYGWQPIMMYHNKEVLQ